MGYQYEHIRLKENVLPGLRDTLLVAPVEWLIDIKVPEDDGVTLDSIVLTALGKHSFYPGFGFVEILLMHGRQALVSKSVSSAISLTFEHKFSGMAAGSYYQLHTLMALWKDKPLLALFKDADCRSLQWYQMGTMCSPAYWDFQFGTGSTNNEIKGYGINITSYYDSMILYRGVPTLLPQEALYILMENGEDFITDENENNLQIEQH